MQCHGLQKYLNSDTRPVLIYIITNASTYHLYFCSFLFQPGLSKAICIFRHSHASQINVTTLLELLTRYTAGIRYALELQSLQKGMSETGQAEDDDTNHSVSSIEEDFVTAFEHLEEEENGDCSCRSIRYFGHNMNIAHTVLCLMTCIVYYSL